MPFSFLPAIFLGLAAQPSDSVEPPLTQEELAFLCSMPPDLKAYAHVSSMPKDRGALALAAQRKKNMQFRKLPPSITCSGIERKLREGTDFLDQLGFSADGTVAVVTGGYVKGPLYGQGGDCYFTRNDDQWSFLGCSQTWVS